MIEHRAIEVETPKGYTVDPCMKVIKDMGEEGWQFAGVLTDLMRGDVSNGRWFKVLVFARRLEAA